MAESVSSESGTSESVSTQPLDRIAGIGGLVGAASAVLALVSLAASLVPVGLSLEIPSLGAQLVLDPVNIVLSGTFIILLGVGLLLQFKGARVIRSLLESSSPLLMILTAIVSLAVASVILGGMSVQAGSSSQVGAYKSNLALAGSLFIIMWQLNSVVYVDSSKSYVGLAAGLMNGFFLPLLAIAPAAGYGVLLVGQLMTVVFWWGPRSQIREFARSTDTAKFGFGLSGLLTFLVGGVAAFGGALQSVQGVQVWLPWSSGRTVGATLLFATGPWLVQALLSSMLFWAMLGPRLGARELRESQISEDIVKGGWKYLMIFMAIIGIVAAGVCGTGVAASGQGSTYAVPEWSVFLTLSPAAIMFLMGSAYTRCTDIVTGLPLVLVSIYILIGPYVLASVIIFAWALVILTQTILMIETWFRKFTHFSQTFLTVIVTIGASVLFIVFMLGGFGSGPDALWPTNRWFNVALVGGIPPAIQGPTILATVVGCLLVRNVAVAGYGFGRGYTGTAIIGGMSTIFALMTITISGNQSVTHQALTTAALSFGLYAVSFVLVLSLNLNLGSDILKAGYQLEGQFVRVAAAVGLVAGMLVAIFSFGVFSRFPSATDISIAITLLVMLIVSIEATCIITWASAGFRLKLITQGYRLKMPQ